MSQQILIIGGANTFNGHAEYLSALKSADIKLEYLKPSFDWKMLLQQELGEKFEVFTPKMPNKDFAKYDEWVILFEKVLTQLKDDLILVGHSMGGIFLAKYLSENKINTRIKATLLVAAPYDDETLEPLASFKLSRSLDRFAEQAGKVFLFQSKNDQVVSVSEFEKYKSKLPNAEVSLLDGRNHFHQESFPEIIKALKSL